MLAMPAKKWSNGTIVFSVVKSKYDWYRPIPKELPPRQPDVKVKARKSCAGYNPECPPFPVPISFSLFECETKVEHGDFILEKGEFTVKTSGLYLLHLSGYYKCGIFPCNYSDCVKLNKYHQADDDDVFTTIAASIESVEVRRKANFLTEFPPVVVTALLPLKAGEKIVAFRDEVRLHEAPPTYTTRYKISQFDFDKVTPISGP